MARYDFRSPRLHLGAPLAPGAEIGLEKSQAHYLQNVLRLKPGDAVLVFNGRDGEWRAALSGTGKRAALTLQESTYPPVQYIPREDVDMTRLARTTHATYCPYKGDASYYSIRTERGVVENAVWSYESPYDAVASIKDHLAFYPNRVDRIEEQK